MLDTLTNNHVITLFTVTIENPEHGRINECLRKKVRRWQAEKASFKATMQEYFDASSSNALDTAVDYDTEDSDYKWVQIL